MGQQLHLLAKPDIRALRDAREWFLDGRQLICRLPVLWLIASSGICFALLLLSIPMFVISWNINAYLVPLMMGIPLCFCFVLQSCAYRLMGSRIGSAEKLRLREMFRLPERKACQPFLRCLLFLAVLHGVIMAFLVMWFFYICFYFSYFQYFLASKWPVRLICAGMSFMVFSITWAILPILSVFPETGFSTILRLQLYGTLRNWRLFCYFILFAGGLFFLLYLAETYFSFMTPYSVEIGFLVAALLWPRTYAWRFSAARHIFMIRE